MKRVGPGERGKPVRIKGPKDARRQREIGKIEGMCGLCSDKISVNRSLPDTRPQRCLRTIFHFYLRSHLNL